MDPHPVCHTFDWFRRPHNLPSLVCGWSYRVHISILHPFFRQNVFPSLSTLQHLPPSTVSEWSTISVSSVKRSWQKWHRETSSTRLTGVKGLIVTPSPHDSWNGPQCVITLGPVVVLVRPPTTLGGYPETTHINRTSLTARTIPSLAFPRSLHLRLRHIPGPSRPVSFILYLKFPSKFRRSSV